jgi:hypothetical protein
MVLGREKDLIDGSSQVGSSRYDDMTMAEKERELVMKLLIDVTM